MSGCMNRLAGFVSPVWMSACLVLLPAIAMAEAPGPVSGNMPGHAPGHDSSPAAAQPVYSVSADVPLQRAYDAIYKSLEDEKFYVVFEPDIGANMARMAKRWGEDYNRNKLTGLRSMVFCNGWYANKVSNLDPQMLGFCPMHISLYEQRVDGGARTTVLFNRPTAMTAKSPAHGLFQRIENEVTGAIRTGLTQASVAPAEAPAGQ